MKTPVLVLALTLAGCATDHSYDPPALTEQQQMTKMMQAGTPGEVHEDMAGLVGDWDVEYRWWKGPDGEPVRGTGTSTYRSIMGGRYLVEEFHSQFFGQPFEGMLLMGYDNVRQQFQTVWIDSMSTGMGLQLGTLGTDGIKRLQGEHYDYMTPTGRPMRSELSAVGETVHEMEMFDTAPDGTEYLSMSFRYKRAGS